MPVKSETDTAVSASGHGTAGVYDDTRYHFQQPHGQDGVLESMAAAAQAVHNYFKGNVAYLPYDLIDIDSTAIDTTEANGTDLYNVYDLQGVKLLTSAPDTTTLTPGLYIVNGRKTLVE